MKPTYHPKSSGSVAEKGKVYGGSDFRPLYIVGLLKMVGRLV